jgi:hypothetical protein
MTCPPMCGDRAVRQVQPLADLLVRQAGRRERSDLALLRGERDRVRALVVTDRLARCAQLAAGACGPRRRAELAEDLACGGEVTPGVTRGPVPAQAAG